MAAELGILEQFEVMAGVVDLVGYQDRGAAVAVEAGFEAEVLDDVCDDALLALTGAQQGLHGRPLIAEYGLLIVIQALGLMLEPLIDGVAVGELLGYVPGLILEVEDDLVGDGLVELVGVDIGAEDVPGQLLVLAEQGGAREADEDGVLHPALHLPVHVSALGTVALVDEDVEAAGDLGRLASEV